MSIAHTAPLAVRMLLTSAMALCLYFMSVGPAPCAAPEASGFIRVFSADHPVTGLYEFQGKLLFTVWGGQESQLFLSDGTGKGTKRIHTTAKAIAHLSAASKCIYFIEQNLFDDNVPYELWRTDGVTEPQRIAELWTPAKFTLQAVAPNTADIGVFCALGENHVVFTGLDDAGQGCVWTSDGTAAGTRPIPSFKRGSRSGNLVHLGRHAFFDVAEKGLFSTDGTSTTKVLDYKMMKGWSVSGGRLFCLAYEGKAGKPDAQVYSVEEDGKATALFLESDRGPFQPSQYSVAGEKILFIASQVLHGRQVWASMGGSSTRLVKDFSPDRQPGPEVTALLGVAGEKAYFSVNYGEPELWCSDGTSSGTVKLGNYDVKMFVEAGGRAFFDVPGSGNDGSQIGSSAGTVETTKAIAGSPSSRKPIRGLAIQSSVYVTVDDTDIYRFTIRR